MMSKKILICLFLFLSSINSFANDFQLLDLDEVKITYISFFPGGRDPMITYNGLSNREMGKLLDVNINTTILKYGYWNNLIHSYTDAYSNTHVDGQFRTIGLNMQLGIRVTPFLNIFMWHYSQHLLDTTSDNIGGFPVQDGIGINLILFSKDKHDVLINLH